MILAVSACIILYSRSTIESRQIAENLGLEEAHMMETQRFNQIWRERIEEYQYNTNLSLRAMEERHRKENEELKQSTLSAPKRNYKFSKDVLHLRKLQEYYAKQQDYDQAEIMQEKVRKREQLELIEAGRKNQMKLKQLQSKLSKRHEAELNAQMKRRNAGKEDLLRQRDSELSVLIQRYNNLKSEQKHQHKLESIEVLKYTAKGSTKMKSIQGRSEEKR